MEELNVHGHIVNFEDGSRQGAHYLINLGYDKAEVIFNKAVSNGSATFECDAGGYKLSWAGGSSYTISKKY